jgi:Family of unknown function (DUF5717)N-terminal
MLQCPRCHRANPSEALFCHFDGAELRRVAGRGNGERDLRLPHEFVFPSGRRCRTYDDLVQECEREWEVARDLLSQGVFQQFLATGGRTDLARAAQKATSHPDADIALDTFLTALPAKVQRGPRLDLSLRRLNLGTLHVGETRQVRLAILNQGKGFLHGTLTVADGTSWLRLGEGRGNGQCLIRTASEQEVTIRVDTHGLTAPQQYSTRLTVITNGGIVEVPVGLDLQVQPFTLPPFEGVSTPREMAERMRTHPKPAVPLLENGEIARWFEANGWTYPVSDPTAHGVAAVQQFFEGMGLSKPPTVQLSAGEISQSCVPGEVVSGQLTLRTSARKWVYARVESDAPWLRLTAQNVSGPQQAALAFEAHSQHLQPGRVHEANLQITANAGQVMRVPVHLEVRRPLASKGTVPLSRGAARPLLVGAAAGVIARLLLILPVDLGAGFWLAPPVGTEPADLKSHFLRHFVLLTWWVGALAAAVILYRRGRRGTDLVYGLIAGGVAGLVGSATAACLVPALDWLPRLLLHRTVAETTWSSTTGRAWLGMPLWIALAVVSWACWGILAGFVLGRAGPTGARILSRVANGLARLFRLCGLKRTAARFTVP